MKLDITTINVGKLLGIILLFIFKISGQITWPVFILFFLLFIGFKIKLK